MRKTWSKISTPASMPNQATLTPSYTCTLCVHHMRHAARRDQFRSFHFFFSLDCDLRFLSIWICAANENTGHADQLIFNASKTKKCEMRDRNRSSQTTESQHYLSISSIIFFFSWIFPLNSIHAKSSPNGGLTQVTNRFSNRSEWMNENVKCRKRKEKPKERKSREKKERKKTRKVGTGRAEETDLVRF